MRGHGVLGAVSPPHCAALHPLRLAHGIARAAHRRGVTIHERTPATGIHPERVETAGGTISAQVVVLATEAYTSQLPGRTRELLPLYSLMVATDPLDEERRRRIGLADRSTFTDGRHLLV